MRRWVVIALVVGCGQADAGAPTRVAPAAIGTPAVEPVPVDGPVCEPGESAPTSITTAPPPVHPLDPVLDRIERPEDTPSEWRRVDGDLWSVWLPPDWQVAAIDPTRPVALRARGPAGAGTAECTIVDDGEHRSERWSDVRKDVVKRAAREAGWRDVAAHDVDVPHGNARRRGVHLEYRRGQEGQWVVARFAMSFRPLSLRCVADAGRIDEDGERAAMRAIVRTLRWVKDPTR